MDKTVRVWQADGASPPSFKCLATLTEHTGSINCIAVARNSNVFVTGAADATFRSWRIGQGDKIEVELLQTVTLAPRYFPLAVAMHTLDVEGDLKPLVLAVGGTKTIVQIFVAQDSVSAPAFELKATLTGHEAWIRSLSFTAESESTGSDLIMASASQDKYIRLWRLHRGAELPTVSGAKANREALGVFGQSLSNKPHRFDAAQQKFSVTFEALLLGHEDWIYTTAWKPGSKLQLLSSSADNSLAMWEPDPDSGVWVSTARIGELSSLKGSTSATGSTGGFWIGLWSPDGTQVASLGKTGSWRRWSQDPTTEDWSQVLGISGHVRPVNGIQWDSGAGYLLSTSSDQTTRLHAQWKRGSSASWHEFSRPQIHGYDLNCIDTLGPFRFISGADEKLLRVFDQPKQIAHLLKELSGYEPTSEQALPESAYVENLGLSNKAAEDTNGNANGNADGDAEEAPVASVIQISTEQPPFEDILARHTLWPEHEKLYGHGYEISAVASSHDGSLVATACKGSSINHAVIRLYNTTDWKEVRPVLKAHTLTVTSLAFSDNDEYLVSVGRDRQWAVFKRDKEDERLFALFASNPKGHTRMILDAAWAPFNEVPVFATAGRDKSVKIWQTEGDSFETKCTIQVTHAVTAVAFLPWVVDGAFMLALGEETGRVSIHKISSALELVASTPFVTELCPSKAITELIWKPSASQSDLKLAVASEDTSLRIFDVTNATSN